ncbi:MAG TPA: hypothetical protein ENK43_16825 [Planctomycetes bacterium]|nr:hypothetical protein [Planctomycetota bacterium]
MKTKRRIAAADARWGLKNPDLLPESTANIEPRDVIIGQDRAIKALKLGLELYRSGYNVFVCGIAGTGRTSTVRRMLDRLKPHCALAEDYCFVHNFLEPERPRLIQLPRGQAPRFRDAVHEMVKLLRREIESLINSETVRARVRQIESTFLEKAGEKTRIFQEKLGQENLGLARSPDDKTAFPELVYLHGEKAVDLASLELMAAKGEISPEEAQRARKAFEDFEPILHEFIAEQQRLQSELIRERGEAEKKAVAVAIGSLKNLLLARFRTDAIEAWIDQVEKTILDNLDVFRSAEPPPGDDLPPEAEGPDFSAFDVNVILTSDGDGCPIVVENNPTWTNLFGNQDRVNLAPGVYGTDFSRIKPGSIVRAQGGYLILNAADVLNDNMVWQNLKRVLRTQELVIQPPENQPPQGAPILNPDPIPMNVKVILLGSSHLYELISENDHEFGKVFKVKADFDTAVDVDKETLDSYLQVLIRVIRDEKLKDITRDGLLEVLEESMRLAGRKGRLSTRFSRIADMLREADYHAERESSPLIQGSHVRTAVHDYNERLNLLEEKLLRRIREGDIHIDTEGREVGQINGLTVISVGEHAFGLPARVTCRVGVGKNGILDIEREAEMTGSTFEKGGLILQGFLTGRYATTHPLTFSASLCFEQSYSFIDGDSASSTELFCILSALANAPIEQQLAVTGSVDQFGRIQPVGGINEKVEGFFSVCMDRGLTGSQGVILPQRNVGDLMLSHRVVEAVEKKQFHIFAITTVDEGMEILTGLPSGVQDERGRWTPDSLNDRIQIRLKELHDLADEDGDDK